MTNLCDKFNSLCEKANNIDCILETWNILVDYKEFDTDMTKSFIKILGVLQGDLILDIDNLNNDFIVLNKSPDL